MFFPRVIFVLFVVSDARIVTLCVFKSSMSSSNSSWILFSSAITVGARVSLDEFGTRLPTPSDLDLAEDAVLLFSIVNCYTASLLSLSRQRLVGAKQHRYTGALLTQSVTENNYSSVIAEPGKRVTL